SSYRPRTGMPRSSRCGGPAMSLLQISCPACREHFSLEPAKMAPQAHCPACGRVLLWYHSRNRQKTGPVSFAQLRQFAVSGQLEPTDSVLLEGAQKWQTADLVAGLFSASSLVPPPQMGST